MRADSALKKIDVGSLIGAIAVANGVMSVVGAVRNWREDGGAFEANVGARNCESNAAGSSCSQMSHVTVICR